MFFHLSNKDDVPRLSASVLETARSKLVGADTAEPFSNCSRAAKLAVADVRLCLDYEPGRRATEMMAELVAGHMRHVFSVPRHRLRIRSGYPSEPIIAEVCPCASLDLLHPYENDQLVGSGDASPPSEKLAPYRAH